MYQITLCHCILRDIRGKDNIGWYGEYSGLIANDQDGKFGALKGIQNTYSNLYTQQSSPILLQEAAQYGIGIDANVGKKEDNPMSGHAGSNDIHPYSIRLLYLISY